MQEKVMTTPGTFSVPEASALLGISERHGYEMARTGRIPTIRLGKRYVIPRRALLAMLGESDEASVQPTELRRRPIDIAPAADATGANEKGD